MGVVWVLSGMACLLPMKNRPGLSLREVFDVYVRSVQQSDLETLFTTISGDEKFTFLTARGQMIDTREGYYRFHERWFRKKEWKMPVDLVSVHEEDDFGYVVAIFHYQDRESDNRLRRLDSYFTLIFHKEEGMWRVVADICTPIQK